MLQTGHPSMLSWLSIALCWDLVIFIPEVNHVKINICWCSHKLTLWKRNLNDWSVNISCLDCCKYWFLLSLGIFSRLVIATNLIIRIISSNPSLGAWSWWNLKCIPFTHAKLFVPSPLLPFYLLLKCIPLYMPGYCSFSHFLSTC